jgi:hypothetical protein
VEKIDIIDISASFTSTIYRANTKLLQYKKGAIQELALTQSAGILNHFNIFFLF